MTNVPIRVVLADDESAVRALLGVALGVELDISVVGEAADGEQAVSLVDSCHPDAIILDLMMPVLDGMEAIGRIKDAWPDCKIVVFSALDAARMSAEALTRGADAYVEKTRIFPELGDTLSRLCVAA